jgi:hypothetical protein
MRWIRKIKIKMSNAVLNQNMVFLYFCMLSVVWDTGSKDDYVCHFSHVAYKLSFQTVWFDSIIYVTLTVKSADSGLIGLKSIPYTVTSIV